MDPDDLDRLEGISDSKFVTGDTAVDPETGVCGAAVASKFLAVGKVVPHVRANLA